VTITWKGFTVKQPYAQLLADSSKRYETRSKPTSYRGPVVIHAGLDQSIVKQYTKDFKTWWGVLEEDHDWLIEPQFQFAYNVATTLAERHPYQVAPLASRVGYVHGKHRFVFGAIIAYADLVDCHRVEDIQDLDEKERLFGHWEAGRYAWEIAHVRRVKPFPYRGQLGLWNIPWDAVRQLEEFDALPAADR
jgi:hypothetical protein